MALNVKAYLAANPDVAAAVARGEMTAEQHYQNYGQYEGRDPGGATSGAQTNFYDNPNWQAANPGGTRASGIRPANFDVNLNGLPNTAYYQIPYQWEGQTYGGRLDAVQMKQLQDRVAAGEDYNTVAMRLLGDGMGTGAREDEKGLVAQDYDVGTGTWVAGGTAGGTRYQIKDGKIVGATRDAGTSQGRSAGLGGGGAGSGYAGGSLSMAQQALLKALMDQQERDAITGEMRANASELYDRTQGYEEDALRDIALYTGGNSGIYNRYQPDIENDVATAVADARVGQTQALNTAARQAMRYGINPAINLAGVSTTQAAQLASAANNTRNNAIANYRNLVGQGVGMKEGTFRTSQAATADSMGRAEAASMGNRNMRIQDESLDWAKQLDVTGLARGMPGASQGAYGVAVGAGNSAVQNQMAPGQALIGAMGQANNTTMQGRNLAMQGTLGVLNAQTSYANAVGQSGDSFGSLLGGVGGLVGGLAKAGVFGSSDRRLKENIEAIGRDERTGLTIYEFSYIDDPDMRRYVGVMADEVIAYDPRAVSFDEHGYARVDYARLGIEFKEVV